MLNFIPLFSDLSSSQLASIGAHVAMRAVEKGELIVKQGDAADSIYVMVSGKAKVFMSNEQQREVILNTIGPGDFFGELPMFDFEPRSASVAALEQCYVQSLSYKALQRSMEKSPEISRRLMLTMAGRLRHADRQIATLALLNISERVSRALMELAIMSNGQRIVGKPFTQKDLADMIGASREMVNRTLKSLTDQGHIEVNRKSITILNEDFPQAAS